VYETNYGFLPGVIAPDGEGLDAYVLGVEEPVDEFTGCCIAIVHRLDDDDDKLVVVREGIALSDDEIRAQTRFQEQFFESQIVRAQTLENTREIGYSPNGDIIVGLLSSGLTRSKS
jgi:inorganic pyrophosphatase